MSNLLILILSGLALFMIITLARSWRPNLPKICPHGVWIRKEHPANCIQCQTIRTALDAERRRVEEERKAQAEAELLELQTLRAQEVANYRSLNYLEKMDPVEFEHVVCQGYRNLGYDVTETKATGDMGVDAYLKKDGQTTILQCKRFTTARVGSPALRDLLGTVVSEGAVAGTLVTTSSFTEEARAFARKARNIDLVDGSRLIELLSTAFPDGTLVPEQFITGRRYPKVVPSECPRCGAATIRRKGRHGTFYGCTGFPNCRWTMPNPRQIYRSKRR